MGGNSRPLAGCQLLILSANRELRAEAQAAVRHMGMLVDVVGNVAEADQFCREGLPHVLLFDAALTSEPLLQLIAGIGAMPRTSASSRCSTASTAPSSPRPRATAWPASRAATCPTPCPRC
jgi:hypothetical protein